MKELNGFLTAGKSEKMEDIYKSFEKLYKAGYYNSSEMTAIIELSNLMLEQRMTASPYFSKYLTGLMSVKKTEFGEQRFREWHDILGQIIGGIENRRLKPFSEFLGFSESFFEQNALRYSKSGVSWYVVGQQAKMEYRDNQPVIVVNDFDLLGKRGKDSIVINKTSGIFYPTEEVWKGKGGRVTWERFGLAEDVYAELADYEFEVKKSLYEGTQVKLHYPLYFGDRKVVGKFQDKLSAASRGNERSYPRFESDDQILEIDNIGQGIKYKGGFRLQGLTVYGFGSKNVRAEMTVYDEGNELTYRGLAELFAIKREEKIVAERVESTLYFGTDSLYHPSVNVRFEIPTKTLELSRGKRGSDRNPFYNSLHQVNIDVEKIDCHLQTDSVFIGTSGIGFAKDSKPVTLESLKFFAISDYQRIQNISTTNPISLMKIYSDEIGEKIVNADALAKRLNPRFTVENINSLLYDLVSQGFINYDAEEKIVELKDKVFHYADASTKKVDFDNLRINSETKETNAILNLKDNSITTKGVDIVNFSQSQRVGLLPFNKQIIMYQNRDMIFDGKIFAGFSTFMGKDYRFDYNKFQVEMDSVRFFDLFTPTGVVKENGEPEAVSIGSRVEHVTGVLLIDAPSNKSGREDIEIFPSFQSKDKSFVFYDSRETKGGAYKRDSFYFELAPFSFNKLDRYVRDDVQFKGEMYSADIFPVFKETLTLQEDESLGYVTKTPEKGYPNYQGKGNYTGEVNLSNQGFLGQGTLKYLGANIDAEDFVFKPKQLTASAERFDLEEDRNSEVQVPQVRGYDVKIDWRPYKDSMYVRSKEAPFELYKSGDHTLKGTLILTPGGLKGTGLLDWSKASMTSELFSFGAYSATADTTDLKIRAFDADAIALKTSNLNGIADFDAQIASFKANAEFLQTVLPYNQYETSFNEFDWDMAKETVTFKAAEGKLGSFLSIHPDQDSLYFQGKSALYDLKTNLLKIGGVPFIISSDAFIYSETGDVEIQPGAIMTTLNNAKIVADTTNQLHVINRATVNILGKKEYRASGFYEYNIGEKEQEIEFAEIVGTRVGKGSRAEKASVTRATGEVTSEEEFYIDEKTKFQGTISLSAENVNLKFDGFAKLESEKLPARHWFTVSCEADKNDLAIPFDVPKNPEGESLYSGLFLSKETASVYPRVMMPKFFTKDRNILPVKGILKYDDKLTKFILGDSLLVLEQSLKGNKITYNNSTGRVDLEGKFDIGSGLKYVSVEAAGKGQTEFGELVQDTLMGTEAMASQLSVELMAGLNIKVPENLMKIIVTDFKSSTFETNPINYTKDMLFFKKGVLELFPEDKDITNAANMITSGSPLVLPKKMNNYSFFFNKLPMIWDRDYQSFVTTKKKVGLVSIDGEMINSMVTVYIEFKMPTNEDDRMYIHIKSPSELYYYFGYKQGILSVVSNNTRFMDEVAGMKEKDRIFKMDDGGSYEIQPVNPSTANAFVRRAEAVGK